MGGLIPRRSVRRVTPRLHERLDLRAEAGIGRHPLQPVSRHRLQDDPWIVRTFPQHGIQLPPHVIGAMIPRRTQIQRQLSQVLVSVDVPVCKPGEGIVVSPVSTHDFCFRCALDPSIVALTIASASFSRKLRWSVPQPFHGPLEADRHPVECPSQLRGDVWSQFLMGEMTSLPRLQTAYRMTA